MSFKNKLSKAFQEMDNAGIKRKQYDSLLLTLLRKTGLKVKPFHYSSFFATFAINSIWFGCFWGLFMWLVSWKSSNLPVAIAISVSIGAGALFGVMMSFYFRSSAAKHHLSQWQDL